MLLSDGSVVRTAEVRELDVAERSQRGQFFTYSLAPEQSPSLPRIGTRVAGSDPSCLFHGTKTGGSTLEPACPGPSSSKSGRADTYRAPWTSARMVRKSEPKHR